MNDAAIDRSTIRRIIKSYDSRLVQAYCTIRFQILRRSHLEEIGQYLPKQGSVLDVGCGFGLFALYFAITRPDIEVQGFDLNERRIASARRAAAKLGVLNVHFQVADASTFTWREPLQGAYLLDLIHHIPVDAVRPLLNQIISNLAQQRYLIVKDIARKPFYKVAFTWLLDKAMDFRAPVHYWRTADLTTLLKSLGVDVFHHRMADYLPYPHALYVCHKECS